MVLFSSRNRRVFRKGFISRLLGVDILEDRLTPSVVDMSWSTSLPYDVEKGGQTVSMPGEGVSLSEHHHLNYTSTVPDLTPEMEARLDRWANRPVNDTPAFPDVPYARPGTTPAQETPRILPEGDVHQTAPNDFVFYRNRTNAGADASGSTSNVGEPSVGGMNRAVFETGNWYASVSGDYGGNFDFVDPATSFGDVGGAFCCDQRVAVDNNNGQLFWYLQYDDNGSFGGVRIARAVGQNGIVDGSWTSWTFTPSSFGFAATGKWLDFPHMQVSSNRLWATSNVFDIGGTSATHSVIWTANLSEFLAGGSISYNYWTRTDGYSIAPAQNATTTMYLASYYSTTEVRFYSTAESPLSLFNTLKSGLNSSYNGTHNTPSPDGNNWTGRASNRIMTVMLSGTTLTSMWNTAQGGSRPNSFMRILQVNTASSYATVQDYDYWFSAGTAHYPAGAINARGHMGVTYFYGDSTYSASPATFLVDDITTTFTGGVFAATSTNGGNNRWGDYLQTQVHNVYDNTWMSSAYRLIGAGSGSGHQANIDVRYLWYGRERDTPNFTLGAITDIGDTIAASYNTGLSGSSGSFSKTDQIWSIAQGRRDVDMYRFGANASTRVLMETSQPAGGDSMDTYLRLFNSGGSVLDFDDDAGVGNYSQLKYTITSNANYYVGISGYSNSTYSATTAGSGTLGAMGDFVMDITMSAATVITGIQSVTSPRNSSISTLDVTFSRALTLGTFTYADLSLSRNGGANLITPSVTVTFVSGTTYRINGLSGLTGTDGDYDLTVDASGINDVDGYACYGSSVRSWTMDTVAPQILDIINVSPDPRNTSVSTIRIVFSEPVPSLLYSAITFTRNGSPITFNFNESYTQISGGTWDIGNLGEETALEGNYSFTIAGPNFSDAAGNSGTGTATDTWVQDFTPPTVLSMVPIAPDPRNTAVSTIRITFSELIGVLPFSSIPITRNGGAPITYSGNETLTLISGTTYDLGGLAEETALDGNYSFTCSAVGIIDTAGNVGTTTSVSGTWVMDTVAPTVLDVIDVTPDPRTTAVASIQVTFSELIQTIDYSNLLLTRNGSPVTFSGNETFNLVSGTTYQINNLTEETGLDGAYVFTFNMGGMLDFAGNVGSAGSTASDNWVKSTADTTPPTIVGVFFDGTVDSDGAGTADNVWSAAFRTAAGNAAYGYPAQTGAGQLTNMPWSTVDTVYVKYSENVIAGIGQLVVNGVNVPSYAISSFSYDNVNFVAKWVLTSNFDTDKVTLNLDGTSASAVRDSSGNKLAGAWTENVSTFPTSGAAAVNFIYRFKIGVGDADRNGLTRNADINLVRTLLFVDAGTAGYNLFADVDGNGLTRNADINIVRAHLFVDPPPGPPPGRPTSGGQSRGENSRLGVFQSRFVAPAATDARERSASLRRLAGSLRQESVESLDEALAQFA